MSLTKFKKFFLTEWPLLIFVLAILLRLPALFEPFTYGDEGIYLTLGQGLRRGLLLYRDLHDNKPPLIYLVAAAFPSFPLYRLFLFLLSGGFIWLFWRFGQKFFPRQDKAQFITLLIFTLLYSLPLLEGNIANAENFFLGFNLLGFYLLLFSRRFFLAGLAFSLAFLFKIPAGFDFLAALIFVCFTSKKFSKLLTVNCLLLTGFFLPILASFIYFWSRGALPAYFSAAFAQNLPYLASWSGPTPTNGSPGLPLALIGRFFGLVISIALAFFFRRRWSTAFLLVWLWFAASLFGALLSTRPYPHYLLQVVPALALSFGFRLLPWGSIVLITFIWLSLRFWYYPTGAYYANFWQYATQKIDQASYYRFFHPQTNDVYQLARYVRQHTTNNERIFIWSNTPSLYALANRLPLNRFTTSYHIFDFQGQNTTLKDLFRQPPRYLIIDQQERAWPELVSFVQEKYGWEKSFSQFQLYHLKKI